ncbi:hypothetical protein D3C80_1478860 [compost metagenome]
MPLILVPSPPTAGVDVLLPARTPITAPLVSGPSAPNLSLSRTLILTVAPSAAEAVFAAAVGRSSTILTTMVLVVLLPRASVAL